MDSGRLFSPKETLKSDSWWSYYGQTPTLASYDMIASHSLFLFIEQNSRLNEDECYGTHQAVNVDLWMACTKPEICGYGGAVNRENRFL